MDLHCQKALHRVPAATLKIERDSNPAPGQGHHPVLILRPHNHGDAEGAQNQDQQAHGYAQMMGGSLQREAPSHHYLMSIAMALGLDSTLSILHKMKARDIMATMRQRWGMNWSGALGSGGPGLLCCPAAPMPPCALIAVTLLLPLPAVQRGQIKLVASAWLNGPAHRSIYNHEIKACLLFLFCLNCS